MGAIKIKQACGVYAKFYMVGVLQSHNILNSGSFFEITPINACFGRMLALLGAIFRHNAMFFSTGDTGLNFSTRKLSKLSTRLVHPSNSQSRDR
jgi:hypothetical protein